MPEKGVKELRYFGKGVAKSVGLKLPGRLLDVLLPWMETRDQIITSKINVLYAYV